MSPFNLVALDAVSIGYDGIALITKLQLKFAKAENRLRGTFLWSAMLAGATGFSAFFMFITHIVAVRVLSIADYGEISSAIALVGIVGVAASSIQAVTVREVKGVQKSAREYLTPKLERLLLGVIASVIGVAALFFINVSPSTSLLLGLWVPIAVLLARANGELQGRELQVLLHGGTTLITLTSLISSSVFALFAPEVDVFLLGRFCVTVIFSFLFLRMVRVPIGDGLRFLTPGIFQSTAIVGSMWFAANLDVLMGRALLDADSVGQIAVAALLVNSVLLMPGLISSVVYPRAVDNVGSRKGTVRLLLYSLSLAAVLQLLFALVLSLVSDGLIDWLAGDGHEEAKRLVFPLALAYIPLGISIVMSQFLLALGRKIDGIVFVLLVGFVASLTFLGSDTATSFVGVINWASWVLAVGLFIQIFGRVRSLDD